MEQVLIVSEAMIQYEYIVRQDKLTKIYTMLAALNDDRLVDPLLAPNANIIYHLYSNGEITYQKGGEVYGKRSEFSSVPAIKSKELVFLIDINKFSHKNFGTDSFEYGYIITTLENAYKIRHEMLLL